MAKYRGHPAIDERDFSTVTAGLSQVYDPTPPHRSVQEARRAPKIAIEGAASTVGAKGG